MRRNLVTAFLSIAGGRVLTMLVTGLVTPLLARILGPGLLGEYATLMAVFGLLMILVSSGINDGARKFLAEERDLPDWKANVFGYYFRLATLLASAMAVLLVLAGASGVAARLLGPEYTLYCYLLAVLTLAAQFREYSLRSLMGMKREDVYGVLKVFHQVVFSVAARSFGYRPFTGARLARIVATVALAAGPILLLAAAIEGPIVALVVVPPAGFVAYAVASILTGAIDVDEVLEVLGALPAPVGPRASRIRERVDDPRGRLLSGLVPFWSNGRSE